MNSLDFSEIRQKMPQWIVNSITLFILVFRLGELFPENLVINLIFLVIFPTACMIYWIYKYVQTKQTSQPEILKMIFYIESILLLAYSVLNSYSII